MSVSGKEIVTLVEDFHRAAKGPKQWVRRVLLSSPGFLSHLVRVWSLDPSLEIGSRVFQSVSYGLCLEPYSLTPTGRGEV